MFGVKLQTSNNHRHRLSLAQQVVFRVYITKYEGIRVVYVDVGCGGCRSAEEYRPKRRTGMSSSLQALQGPNWNRQALTSCGRLIDSLGE